MRRIEVRVSLCLLRKWAWKMAHKRRARSREEFKLRTPSQVLPCLRNKQESRRVEEARGGASIADSQEATMDVDSRAPEDMRLHEAATVALRKQTIAAGADANLPARPGTARGQT